MKFDSLIDIKTTIDGKQKYYYCNLAFDTYAKAEAYIESLEKMEVPKEEPIQKKSISLIASTYEQTNHGKINDFIKEHSKSETSLDQR